MVHWTHHDRRRKCGAAAGHHAHAAVSVQAHSARWAALSRREQGLQARRNICESRLAREEVRLDTIVVWTYRGQFATYRVNQDFPGLQYTLLPLAPHPPRIALAKHSALMTRHLLLSRPNPRRNVAENPQLFQRPSPLKHLIQHAEHSKCLTPHFCDHIFHLTKHITGPMHDD